MKTLIDISSWKRREHFAFFSGLHEPFHGIVADIPCTQARQFCRDNQISFFLFYLHRCLAAINQIPELRYRVQQDQVVLYQQIHANATIGRADHSFGFCPIDYQPAFGAFCEQAELSMARVKSSEGLCFTQECQRDDVIHFSAMPWIAFNGITHARHHDGKDSAPKVSVGKCVEKNGELVFPVAVFAHHGLADAYHIHQFFDAFTEQLRQHP
ncbi:chloramphenicol acetyltransferase [Undibacterium sp. CY7W]|uniref:Chloramphenicol acetyltransferase n=1 Tax=Undibacterium rugosum TaxID=2762291 RepID=A0A923I3A7_9BURK|nr:CatA-like O-acetyltransferase [Undibacterium rugosum]MBC3936983.1 chloramphenicol acetyltransferase [Undibacterium rugosum]